METVPQTLNPRVASLNESKTMVLTDLARAMKEEGKPVRSFPPRSRMVARLLIC